MGSISITVLITLLVQIVHGYQIYYIYEDSRSVTLGLPSSMDSTLILKPMTNSRKGRYQFTIKPPPKTGDFQNYGLVATMKDLNLRQDGYTCIDNLEIWKSEDYLNRAKKVFSGCRTSSSSFTVALDAAFSYDDDSLTFKLDVGDSYKTFKSFEITVTAFNKNCGFGSFKKDYEFYCSLNKCIYKKLKCDGRDNCGDNEDESDSTCSPALKGYQIGIIVIVVFSVFVTATSCYMRYRRRRPGLVTLTIPVTSQHREVVPPQFSNQQGIYPVQPWATNQPPPQVPQGQLPQPWTTPYPPDQGTNAPMNPQYSEPPPPYFTVVNSNTNRY